MDPHQHTSDVLERTSISAHVIVGEEHQPMDAYTKTMLHALVAVKKRKCMACLGSLGYELLYIAVGNTIS